MAKLKHALVRENIDLIKLILKSKPKQRVKIINSLKGRLINCLSEIFSNFLKRNITSNRKIIDKLRKHKSLIKEIAYKKTPIYKKKIILTSKAGGGVLSILLPLALSILPTLFSRNK